MSSLLAALGNSGNALDVLEQAMGVVQNNVANATAPGYVTQTLQLNSGSFDPAHNEWGGVQAGSVQSARNTFAESSVWNANQQVGSASQQASNLQSIQAQFDVSGNSGIPKALSTLYSAFSAWSTTPTSATAQQQVLAAAQGVAQAFNTTASNIDALRTQARQQTQSVVTQVNQLSSQIASINGQIRQGGQNNGGLQAQLYTDLESLPNLVDMSAQFQSDGTVSVLMGGQVPLVTGETQTALSVTASNSSGSGSSAPPDQQIFTASGADVTGKVQQGQLGGLLNITNNVLPSIVGNAGHQGGLNQLAQGIADRVNALLTSGQTSSGATGIPLLTYNAASPTSAAQTLAVNSGITASQLAAVDPGPPSVANGIADKLAQLENSTGAADMINGQSYSTFYSSLASNVGSLQVNAAQTLEAQTNTLTQAQTSRAQVSGVSLNAQAAALLQFQDAYQASAQALSTIKNTISYLMQAFQSIQ